MMKKNFLLLLLSFLTFHAAMAQKYIKQTATGSGNGSSWDNALGASSLRSALAAGGTVYIAAGTYNVGAAFVPDAVNLLNSTTVQGGFPANATGTSLSGYNPAANTTTIDGQDKMIMRIYQGTYSIKGIVFDNAEGQGAGGTCILAHSGGQLYNWTIEDCIFKNSTGSGGGGGAVWLHGSYIAGSKIKVKNCIFDNNVALSGSYTGALMIHGVANNSGISAATNNGTDYVVEGCSFSNNKVTSGGSGGAVQVLSCAGINFYNNSFCNNSADNDAGAFLASSVLKLVISGCSFTGNTNKGQYSPALYVLSCPESKILNCTFVGNQGTGFFSGSVSAGGGISIESATSHIVDGCKFYDNTVTNRGGGISFGGGGSLTVKNCIFKGNKVTNAINATGGGGVYAASGSSASIIFSDNVFDSNSHSDNNNPTGVGGGAILVVGGNSPVATNSVFYNNKYNNSSTTPKSDVAVFGSGTFTVSNSRLQLPQSAYLSFYNVGTGNSFNNTTNPNVATAPTISCPTALGSICNAGNVAPTLRN